MSVLFFSTGCDNICRVINTWSSSAADRDIRASVPVPVMYWPTQQYYKVQQTTCVDLPSAGTQYSRALLVDK